MSKFRAAVVGTGGREYELGRQLAMSDEVDQILFIGGNGGTAELPKSTNINIDPTNARSIAAFANELQLELTVIGPEASLLAGTANAIRAHDLLVFGPDKKGAMLEGSKAYALKFMDENDIPHPPEIIITKNYENAVRAIKDLPADSYVIKADGIAAGKGVVLPEDFDEAKSTLRQMIVERKFGKAGKGKNAVVIQERYHGPEVTVHVVTDGERFYVLPFSQDHKRLLDGDNGPNTGGIGAYTPVPFISPDQEQKILDIAKKTVAGLNKNGIPYRGVIYIGIMLADELSGDPTVIEYNARFGDPEAQIILPVLSESGVDVFDMMRSTAEGNLHIPEISHGLSRAALTVCLAAEGYPDKPKTGEVIYGLDTKYRDVILQHGATMQAGSGFISNGGRVMYVTGIGKEGESIDDVADRTYRKIGKRGVHFANMINRSDIGNQARIAA